MIIIKLTVEELPDGHVGISVESHRDGGVTQKELNVGKKLLPGIVHCLPLIMGGPPLQSISAETGDNELNSQLIAAMKNLHDKPDDK